jgi:hypothetical protein
MSPEEVPDGLIDLAYKAARGSEEMDIAGMLVDVLAALLPEHEKQVRAKAAGPVRAREQELLKQAVQLNARDDYATARGVECAAYEVRRIADDLTRGES